MKELLKELTPEQKQAVWHTEGPLLVIAGAGTGKTLVITRRIAHLIREKLAKPSEILALTFTEKAAAEMEERVDILVPYGYIDTWISTFHAFGDRILQEHAIEAKLPTDFKVLSKAESSVFFRENLFKFELKHFRPLGNPTSYICAILQAISRLQDENVKPQEAIKVAKSKVKKAKSANRRKEDRTQAEKELELAKAYHKYQELKKEEGLIDFGDQITYVLELFKKNPEILKKYQDQFKYILVDEFQDTNFAQNLLVQILACTPHNITVVGDDDQSIYRFRGAAISNILDFKKNYPQAKEIVLKKNFRSSQEILDSAYNLITHNNPERLEITNKIDKKLRGLKHGSGPNILPFERSHEAADGVAEEIKKLKKARIPLKEIAILVRANNHAYSYLEALKSKNIPAIFSGSSGLYDQEEIERLIAFFKILSDPKDSLSLFYLATSPLYSFSPSEFLSFNSRATREHRSLEEILNRELEESTIISTLKGRVQKLLADLKIYREKSLKLSTGQLLYDYLNKINYFKNITKNPTLEKEIEISNVAKFFERIRQFELVSQDKSVLQFIKSLDSLIQAGDDPALAEIDTEVDAVNVLTIHSAKGLEYKAVFMVDLVSDRFPSRRRGDAIEIPKELIQERLPKGDWHIQEERRLFYVGMTRAEEKLYLVWAKDYGGVRTKKVSPFVLEAMGPKATAVKTAVLSPIEKIKKFKFVDQKIILPRNFYVDKRLVLSHRKVDDYLTCPLKFKYIHLLRIPLIRHHPLVYGIAIHEAVAHYFEHKIKGEKIALEDIIHTFLEAWENEGFISREHEDARIEEGKETLEKFYKNFESFDSAQDRQGRKGTPQAVEDKFSVNLEVNNKPLRIRGRFDLIYKTKDNVEICDFKTSNIKDEKKAQKAVDNSLQMQIYALVFKEKEGIIPDTSLYFIESDIFAKTKFSPQVLRKTEEKIKEAAQGIEKLDFKATPGLIQCRFCPYQDLCPYAYRG